MPPMVRIHFFPAISIHALLAESDAAYTATDTAAVQFLSTLSLRRATAANQHRLPRRAYFYPRSPCGERQRPGRWTSPAWRFLSTLSLRRATGQRRFISEAGDNFYPRSPCGERRKQQHGQQRGRGFLSTLSLRRATTPPTAISPSWAYFYPRSPCGERQTLMLGAAYYDDISIHALLAESDVLAVHLLPSTNGFLSTLSLRRATTDRQEYVVKAVEFLSTLSLRRATNMLAPISDPATQFLSTLSLRRATTAS